MNKAALISVLFHVTTTIYRIYHCQSNRNILILFQETRKVSIGRPTFSRQKSGQSGSCLLSRFYSSEILILTLLYSKLIQITSYHYQLILDPLIPWHLDYERHTHSRLYNATCQVSKVELILFFF